MNRWIVALLVIIAALLALALLGYLTGNWDEDESARPGYGLASAESVTIVCADPMTREKIRDLMSEALDEAFKNHVEHMFEVWMKDERGQPDRARTGTQNGINSYIRASKAVSDWSPPPCS
jgi:hypothetical protein